MTEKKLSTVALQTIVNYRDAAENAVKAYRLGGHRLANAVNGRMNESVFKRTGKIVPAVSDQASRLHNRAFAMTTDGIDLLSKQSTKLISISANTVAAGVSKIADGAAKVDNPYLSKGLDAAAKINLPSAKLALAISEKLAQGAESLSSAAAGPVKPRVKRTARKLAANTRRKAVSSVKPAAKKAAATKTRVVRKPRVAAAELTT